MEKEKSYKTFVLDDLKYKILYSKKFEERKPYEPIDQNLVRAFLPGKILKIMVKEGEIVKAGSDLCILDAMKMENRLKAPIAAKVLKINVKKGDLVSKNTVLIELEPVSDKKKRKR